MSFDRISQQSQRAWDWVGQKVPYGRSNKVAASVGALLIGSGAAFLVGGVKIDGLEETAVSLHLNDQCTYGTPVNGCGIKVEAQKDGYAGEKMMIGGALVGILGGGVALGALERGKRQKIKHDVEVFIKGFENMSDDIYGGISEQELATFLERETHDQPQAEGIPPEHPEAE